MPCPPGQTEPLIEYYRQAGLLREIDGEGDVIQVVGRTMAVARDLASQRARA